MTRALQLLTVVGLGALGGLLSAALILVVASPWDRAASWDLAAPSSPSPRAAPSPALPPAPAATRADAAVESSWGWLDFSWLGFSDDTAAPAPIAVADRPQLPAVAACDRLGLEADGRVLVGTGDCFVRAGGTQVAAAEIRLDLADDAVTALGAVRWTDKAGDRRQAESVRLNGPVRAVVADIFRARADLGAMTRMPAGAPPATAVPVRCAGIVENNGRLVGRRCTAEVAGTGLQAERFEFDPVDGALIALGDVAWWQDGGPPTPVGAARIEEPLRTPVIGYLSRGASAAGGVAAMAPGR